MSYYSQAFIASLSDDQRRHLNWNHLNIGWHPESKDHLLIPHADRYAGMYVAGVQGSGKSGLLQTMIAAEMQKNHAIIVLDPHGDLVIKALSHVPKYRLEDTYLLDIEDEAYPFGLNLFTTGPLATGKQRGQAVDRIMHIFGVLWPEVQTQQYLPLYLPKAVHVFLDNPGVTLVHMLPFFQEDSFRASLVSNVTDPTIKEFWRTEYDALGKHERERRVQPLTNRLHALFTGNTLVRNILGQPHSKINFRTAIEERQIILIKLPTDLEYVSRLIGTIMLAQIQDTVFSFANVPEKERPGVSLYMDEFQLFATKDIEKLYSQGRKFGIRLTVAHQRRDQLPGFLQAATMSAHTKICFNLTPEDGREMAHVFPDSETRILPEDMAEHPSKELLNRTPEVEEVQTFVELYLRPLQGHKRGAGRVEIEMRGYAPSPFEVMNGGRFDNPRIADPTPYLDSLLHQVMVKGDPDIDIPPEIIKGFANCGGGFFKAARGLHHGSKQLTPSIAYPPGLIRKAADGLYEPARPPEGQTERMYYFICCLRLVMHYLADNPIGKATSTSAADVAKMLTQLPKQAAFVRSGNDVGVIYTHNVSPSLPQGEFYERAKAILMQTRKVYCYPRAEVEKLFMQPAQPSAPGQQVGRWEEIE